MNCGLLLMSYCSLWVYLPGHIFTCKLCVLWCQPRTKYPPHQNIELSAVLVSFSVWDSFFFFPLLDFFFTDVYQFTSLLLYVWQCSNDKTTVVPQNSSLHPKCRSKPDIIQHRTRNNTAAPACKASNQPYSKRSGVRLFYPTKGHKQSYQIT